MANYFEGTYYKHQHNGNTLCVIAGKADSGPFVQVITNEGVWQHNDLAACSFGPEGIRLALPEVQGEIRYGPLCKLQRDIMGPFRFLPMQCRHSVLSMRHTLTGGFSVAGQEMGFTGGLGYMESDCGSSFPREYLWLHCNDFPTPCSIMASVADIPLCGVHFTGCICAVWYQGQEYRLATYTGVHIRCASRSRLVLEQRDAKLEVLLCPSGAHPLRAPLHGNMTQTIHESNCTQARFRFWQKGSLLFDLTSAAVSFECTLSKPHTKNR